MEAWSISRSRCLSHPSLALASAILFKGLLQTEGILSSFQEIYSIKLPGDPKLGEGKPENQNHAIVFTRGEAIQTIDMNQVNGGLVPLRLDLFSYLMNSFTAICVKVRKSDSSSFLFEGNFC